MKNFRYNFKNHDYAKLDVLEGRSQSLILAECHLQMAQEGRIGILLQPRAGLFREGMIVSQPTHGVSYRKSRTGHPV